MTIRKIAAGHYQGRAGTAKNIASASGAPHTRPASLWLITYANGRTTTVRSLSIARELIK
jgi:hypothetical protein